MKKIRIGNDIRLLVQLLGTNTYDAVNIHSVKAYIINKSVQDQTITDLKNKTRFISRFPIEPMVDAYTATPYNVNSTGYPSYHAFPQNHVIGSYAGFGVHPDWNNMYRPVLQHNLTEFLAPVKATGSNNIVSIFFPAEAQLFTGDYKIVIVAKLYQPGFSPNDLRTVTMDYENIFTLVNTTSEEGEDSAVTLKVGITDKSDTDDVFTTSGKLNKETGKIEFEYNGLGNGSEGFEVDMSPELLWREAQEEDAETEENNNSETGDDSEENSDLPSDTQN